MPGCRGCWVTKEELSFRLHGQRGPRKEIVVSGIPRLHVFTTRPDRSEAAARLSLNPARFTVLLMGGGAGIGMDPIWITELLKTQPQLQVIVMTGKNLALREALVSLEHELSLIHIGRCRPIREWITRLFAYMLTKHNA